MSKPPILQHVCDYTVELAPIKEMGQARAGTRRIIPIIGGTVDGPLLYGKVLNLGADWQTVFPGGIAELDTRYAIETNDGALIEVINSGYRHGPAEVLERLARGDDVAPEEYYMRTTARLETGDERYDWVNRMVFVGTGSRSKSAVRISLFCVR